MTRKFDPIRDEHQAALDLLIDPVERLVSRLLRKVLKDAVAHAMALTAAGPIDFSALDAVTTQWDEVVQRRILPVIAETYETGGLGMFISAKDATASQYRAVVNRIGERLPEVIPVAGQQYLAGAANRLSGIGDQGWTVTRDALTKGIESGASIPDLQTDVRNAIGVADQRARVIARTEVVGATNAGSIETARLLAGFGPQWKVWLATNDARTRPTHATADGQTVPLEEPFSVGGVSMDRPHDPTAPAGETVNCRCTLTYTDEGPIDQGPEDTLPSTEQEEKGLVKPADFRGRVDAARGEFAQIEVDRSIEKSRLLDERALDPDRGREPWIREQLHGATGDEGAALRRQLNQVWEEDSEFSRNLRTTRNRFADEEWAKGHDLETAALREEASTSLGRIIDDEVQARLPPPADPVAHQLQLDALSVDVRDIDNEIRRIRQGYIDQGMSPGDAIFAMQDNPDWLALQARKRAIMEERVALLRQTPEKQFLTAQSQVVREVLEEAGVVFDDALRVTTTITPRSQAYAPFQAAADRYPARWKVLSNEYTEAGHTLTPKLSGSRAHYRNFDGELLIPDRAGAYQVEVAVHETGHRMEYAVPGVRDMETAFYRRRTEGESLSKLNDLNPGMDYRDNEEARGDKFINPYMGKDYGGSAWELFTMGAQVFLSPQHTVSWATGIDADYRQWFLGVMASLG